MKPTKTIPAKHQALLDIFLDNYLSISSHMDDSCQKGLLEALPLVFSKWYHTALSEDTLLTPANILGRDFADAGETAECIYTLNATNGQADSGKHPYLLIAFSLEDHPLVKDLRLITEFCIPDREMDAHLFFMEKDRKKLKKKLTHKYDFYLEYITRLAWWMGLFVIIPSIHTKKIQRAPICDTLFAQSNAVILRTAAEAACDLAAERFAFSMDLEQGIVSGTFFMEFLRQSTETDKIFIDFYNRVGVDIAEIWHTAPEDLSADDRAIFSSFLFTGIMLDKWFLFPLANFFGFLRPITFTPIKFFYLVNNLSALLIMEHNIGAEIFAPASYYALTDLGKALFGSHTAAPDQYVMPQQLSFDQIVEALERELQLKQFEEVFFRGPDKDILVLRVSRQLDSGFWKVVELDLDTPLDEFCRDLCAAFGDEDAEDYLLSVPDAYQFPVDYSPLGSKRSINKTAGKALRDLALEGGMALALSPKKNEVLTLHVLEQKPGEPYTLYPRIQAQSKKVSRQEHIDEIF